TVGLLLDPAHAAELTIESENAGDGFGLGRIDDERALVGVIAQRDISAHPHALLLRCGYLVPDAFTGDLPLELGKRQQHIECQAVPIELVVLNCCVTETNDTASASKSSTNRAKSARERVSRSTL